MSHKNHLIVLQATIFLALAGCGDKPVEESMYSNNSRSNWGEAIEVREPGEGLDVDWAELENEGREALEGGPQGTKWTIVLKTFAGSGKQDAAMTMIRNAAGIDPRLSESRVHQTSSGSMVVFGLYDSVDSQAAQADLEFIKAVEFRGRQVFPRPIFTRINLDHAAGRFGRFELLAVRKLPQYARIDPLYTLQVAVWGDFESGRLSEAEIRQRAENMVQELRSRGVEAFVHHEPTQKLSMVTVGLFDRHARDVQSGITLDPRLERYERMFTEHLVNGELFEEFVDPRNPAAGRFPQRPRLVVVPQL